jgi:hypothetical protein
MAYMSFFISQLAMSLLQKLTTERTANTEYKELMSKRISERILRQNADDFTRYLINFS